jgi:Metallo-peptidase family M12
MTLPPCVRLLALLALFFSATFATAAERVLDRASLNRLTSLAPGVTQKVDAFPVSATQTASIRFERVQIYADDAHIYVMTADGRKEVPRSNRIFLRGYSDDGAARVAMSLNPDGSFAEGNGSGPEGSFTLRARIDARGANRFSAQSLESSLPAGYQFDFRCGDENQNLNLPQTSDLAKQLHDAMTASAAAPPAAAIHQLRLATIAVDTDSLFMSRLFGINNTTAASNWIAGMFNTMNIMYERDLQVRLNQGTTFLCTSACTDPYTGLTPGATTAELNFFANYWMANHASVVRAFTILLSGQQTSTPTSCSASGIAWIDQYCQKGFASGANTVGSYSVNQVCTSINIDPNGSFNARIVGHEVGHNFGAWHTHCTNTTTGAAPVATNTIDTCFNQEGPAGCYTGSPSCPAAGAGTIMSYCNFTSVSTCAAGTQNLLQFHPTQVTSLDSLIAAQSACLNFTDDIFYDGFQQ